MKLRFAALLLALTLLLSACSYWVVEAGSVQVGSAVARTPAPER